MEFDTFNGNEVPGRVRRHEYLWNRHKGNRSIQKRDRWRRGEGGNEMGGDDAKVSEPAGKSLQDIPEVQEP